VVWFLRFKLVILGGIVPGKGSMSLNPILYRYGFAPAKPTKNTTTTENKSANMSKIANAVFFINSTKNTSYFHAKRCICKESLTQKILTDKEQSYLYAPKPVLRTIFF